MKKTLTLFTLMGLVYVLIELIYRAMTDFPSITLKQSLVALVMGGISGLIIGDINEICKNIKVIYQSLIGVVVILSIELFSGLAFNSDLSIWDYSMLPLNFLGQVSLYFGIAWFFLTPFVMWLDDHLRENIFEEKHVGTFLSYYKRLFTLK